MGIPSLRIRAANARPLRPRGRYVLVWMIAARRSTSHYALDRAVDLAEQHGGAGNPVGVLVLEPLSVDHPFASDRIHAFVLAGMQQNARAFAATPITYHPYVEPFPGHGRGLLQALARDAVAVVTDEYPCGYLPRLVASAAQRLDVRLEVVDGLGILPLRATDRVFTTAHSFRAFLQKKLLPWLAERPREFAWESAALATVEVPSEVLARWPAPLDLSPACWAALPIDHGVAAVPGLPGGPEPAQDRLERFVVEGLDRYGQDRHQRDGTSGLSPYLHFGHLGAHEAVGAVLDHTGWRPARSSVGTRGAREGWWGLAASPEAFLDQLITWRELGANFAHLRPADCAAYDALPEFARRTLAEHAGDERPKLYSLAELEAAETADEVWNAAQRQLVREGRLHSYLRMLWGKNVIAWTKSPAEAFERLLYLNDKYALDGRDPNSYAGVGWIFGRYDRAWGPERPIFGKVRYMTSANTKRKLDLGGYLERYGPSTGRTSEVTGDDGHGGQRGGLDP